MPPTTEPLTLTVNPKGRVHLSRALSIHLGLKHGQPVELLPPTQRRGGRWHLFLPAQGDAPLPKLTLMTGKHYKPQFQSRSILSPMRFRQRGIPVSSEAAFLPSLTLQLTPAELSVSGFLPLEQLGAGVVLLSSRVRKIV